MNRILVTAYFMASEEDTFRKLKQTPFGELRISMRRRDNLVLGMERWVHLLESHGWTFDEYRSSLKKALDSE